jgi:putative transposase
MRAPDPGLYFHSDRGSQYSSQAVRKPLSVIGANLNMSAQGNCYDVSHQTFRRNPTA